MDAMTFYKIIEVIVSQPLPLILLALATCFLTSLVKLIIPKQYKNLSIFVPFPIGICIYSIYEAIITKGTFAVTIGEVVTKITVGNIFSAGAMIGILAILIYNFYKMAKNLVIEKQLGTAESQAFFKVLVDVISNKRDTLTLVKKLDEIDWKDVMNCTNQAKEVLSGFVDIDDISNVVNVLKACATKIETDKEHLIGLKEEKQNKKIKKD